MNLFDYYTHNVLAHLQNRYSETAMMHKFFNSTNKYDLKQIFRLIMNSKTYQLSSIHNQNNVNDTENFSHYYVRRLEAEVLIDAICKITGTTESYMSRVPEPFTFVPEEQRSICLADGTITSAFLDMFGRPPRDTGYENERKNDTSANQMLHLLNSKHIITKIQASKKIRAFK